jgi:fucose 4-O-acetylase-like acetyltransferase
MPEDRSPQAAVRDGFLDCLKGLAILTVVAGHTFQGATPDFDEYWPFRFIYAFHMPMFMFVSGMTAAFFYQRQIFQRPVAERFDISVFGHDLSKKGQRLLIPFFTWAAVSYALNPSGDFLAYMTKVIQFPDNGLWFLPVLFQCSIGLTMAALFVIAFRRYYRGRRSVSWDNRWVQAAAILIASYIVSLISRCIPNGLGLYLARMHFPYVVAGLAYQIALSRGLPALLRPLPYVIFLALVPFWHRTEVSSLIAYLPTFLGHPRSINGIYVMIVAFTGTLAFVDFAGIVYRRLPAFLERSLVFLGQRSLDVYAIHFHLLGTWPPIIAPTLYSLAVSTVLRLNSWTAFVFFGQRRSVLSKRPRSVDHSPALDVESSIGQAAP